MLTFSNDNIKEIQDQIYALGFDNSTSIINETIIKEELSIREDQPIELDNIGNDKNGIDYMFFLSKSELDGKWHLETIQAYLLQDTIRPVEGGMLAIGKSYNITDRPLPNKDSIIKDLSAKAFAEREIDMMQLNIQHELRLLNFKSAEQIANTAKEIENAHTTVDKAFALSYVDKNFYGAEYKFIVQKSHETSLWQIQRIEAHVRLTDIDGPGIFLERTNVFSLDNGSLPTRQRIDREIHENVRVETANRILSHYPELDIEFDRLGFGKDRNKIVFIHEEMPEIYFVIPQQVQLAEGNGTERIGFLIGTSIDNEAKNYKITEITSTLYVDVETRGNVITQELNRRTFLPKDGPLPTKDEILQTYFASPQNNKRVSHLPDPERSAVKLAAQIASKEHNRSPGFRLPF